jgi:hypothetical protein
LQSLARAAVPFEFIDLNGLNDLNVLNPP